ncbi:MAG TPA: hypothetical protein VFX03_01905, partial [Thermomicrobiales bacterium]|nr:hypothetical protein [Thermomicrobiales bacterium]
TKTAAHGNIVHAVDAVAAELHNTRAVCRKSYIHPAILAGYLDGSLLPALANARRHAADGHTGFEAAVLAYLDAHEDESGSRKVEKPGS